MQKDLGPKGFSVLEGAINEDADIPRFIRQFDPPFPVGTAGRFAARDYLQMTMTTQAYVPFMVFIDRKGIIRAQFTGTDKELNDNQQDKYLRALAEKLLAERAPVQSKSKPKR